MPRALDIKSTLAAGEFFNAYTGNPVEIHYALIDGVNDTVEDAIKLCSLIKGKGFNVKFLFYNEKQSLGMHPSEIDKFEMFKKYLDLIAVESEYYKPPGLDIGSSCGSFNIEEYLNSLPT
jgi:23S rRNA (adenine2503-C2)-methyltransferase